MNPGENLHVYRYWAILVLKPVISVMAMAGGNLEYIYPSIPEQLPSDFPQKKIHVPILICKYYKSCFYSVSVS